MMEARVPAWRTRGKSQTPPCTWAVSTCTNTARPYRMAGNWSGLDADPPRQRRQVGEGRGSRRRGSRHYHRGQIGLCHATGTSYGCAITSTLSGNLCRQSSRKVDGCRFALEIKGMIIIGPKSRDIETNKEDFFRFHRPFCDLFLQCKPSNAAVSSPESIPFWQQLREEMPPH